MNKKTTLLAGLMASACILNAQYDGTCFFNGQDLSGHDFRGMSMKDAVFWSGANAGGADFTDADISHAYFYNAANGFTQDQWESTWNYKNKAMTDANFSGMDVSGWDFSGMDLRGTGFDWMKTNGLAGTNFTNSDIRGSDFSVAHGAGFTKEQLYSTSSWKNRDLSGVSFSSSEIDGWNFAGQDLTGADFTGAVLTGRYDRSVTADFTDAIITGADFGISGSWERGQGDFTKEHLYSTKSYKDGDLSGLGIKDNDLRTWNFAGQNLTGANFYNSNVEGADFTGAIIKDANFHWDELNNLYDVDYVGGLTKEQLYSTKSYQDKDLGAIDLGGRRDNVTGNPERSNIRRDLSGWDFSEQNLKGSSFFNAAVSGADFTDADIEGASFSSTNENSDSSIRNPSQLTSAQMYSTKSYKAGNLKGVELEGLNLNGWNFAGKDLSGASVSMSDVVGTDFTGANVTGADFSNITKYGFTKEQFYSTANYASGDLSGMSLAYNDMSGWDFSGKNLSYANLDSATWTGADLTDADVTAAYFSWGKGLTEGQFASTKNFKEKNLVGMHIAANLVSGWNLSGQNMQNATMFNTDFTGTNLTNADLRGAYTYGATNLDAAILRNTIWSDGVVKTAWLEGDADVLVVKNYDATVFNEYSAVKNTHVVTTKISDEDVTMTGGRIIIETGAPLALVQHKSLIAAGGLIVMNYGADGFGVIDVYAESNFKITAATEYLIDFSDFTTGETEFLMVDASHGGTIVGSADDIQYTVMANGRDVSDDWEFFIRDGNLYIRGVIPEPATVAALLGALALAFAACRRK